MRNKYLFILPLISLSMTGCGLFGTYVTKINGSIEPISPYQDDKGEGYQKISDFSFNLQDVKRTTGQYSLNSLGESKILVVPVEFSNARTWTTNMLKVVEKGFFGESNETSWESVSSFYNAASYGKLKIVGEVAPVLKSNYTVEQGSAHLADGDPAPDELIVQEFKNNSIYNSLRKEYDSDNNGFIDSVVFVYSNSINDKTGYWAWVYWNSDASNRTNPTINSYLWMSYDFFSGSQYAGYGIGIDAHTAAHEVGHLLGLDDYYQYDDSKFDPSGAIEMHSFNIGDENIYSKFALGWVNPYYVNTDKSVTLRLRSSALYGDAIVLNDTWNKNSMDEYIIIEYYTPQGMNKQDSESIYKPNGSKANRMYTTNGFRIYHIDSRICEVDIRKGSFKKYSDTIGSGYYVVGASNSPSRSYLESPYNEEFKYLHLMESGGKNTFKTGKIATNDTLFKKGSSFQASSEFFVNDTRFNDGGMVGYKIEINDCQNEYGEITISKI